MYIYYSSKKVKVKTYDEILERTYSNRCNVSFYFDKSKFYTKLFFKIIITFNFNF